MQSSKHLLQLIGVFVAAIGLTVFLGVHQRSGAVTSPGTFLSSPISPLATPTPTATVKPATPAPTPTATRELHRQSLPMIRGGTNHRHWLPLLMARS